MLGVVNFKIQQPYCAFLEVTNWFCVFIFPTLLWILCSLKWDTRIQPAKNVYAISEVSEESLVNTSSQCLKLLSCKCFHVILLYEFYSCTSFFRILFLSFLYYLAHPAFYFHILLISSDSYPCSSSSSCLLAPYSPPLSSTLFLLFMLLLSLFVLFLVPSTEFNERLQQYGTPFFSRILPCFNWIRRGYILVMRSIVSEIKF